VTCPDAAVLRAMITHRAAPQSEEPAGWSEVLDHLDGCPDCRRAALAADPTLLFRRLPALRLNEQEVTGEVAEIQRAVAAMRTASRMEPRGGRRRGKGVSRWAAAAALAIAALSLGSSPELHPGRVGVGGTLSAMPRPAAMGPMGATVPAALRIPSIEELDRPEARIYQMGGPDLSVVMIVDEGLDV
jgi:hypothetical protein